jgi:hypothetical protein
MLSKASTCSRSSLWCCSRWISTWQSRLWRPGQAAASSRTARSGLRAVYGGVRYARPEGGQGAAGGVGRIAVRQRTRTSRFQREPSTGYDAPQLTGDAMKRRSKAGGEQIKARRRKTPEPKRHNAPKAVARSNSSTSAKGTEVARLTRELNEALEREAATSGVLQVISGSPCDLQPVLAAMLENAVRICDAKFGNIYRWDGEALHMLASHNTPPAFAEDRRRSPYRAVRLPSSQFGSRSERLGFFCAHDSGHV